MWSSAALGHVEELYKFICLPACQGPTAADRGHAGRLVRGEELTTCP